MALRIDAPPSACQTQCTLNWANRMVQVVQPSGTIEYCNDGDGNLVQRIDSSGTVDFVGQFSERNASTGSVVKRYALGGRLVESRTDGVAATLYGDYLNSTVSAGNGATVEYTPFGLVRTSSGTLLTNRQFQGQQHESAVGLYKMGARWYDPAIGLWTQPDTIVPNPVNPQDYHRYAFVRNNPLRLIDPSGHNPEDSCLIKGICEGELSSEASTIQGFGISSTTTRKTIPDLSERGHDYDPARDPRTDRVGTITERR